MIVIHSHSHFCMYLGVLFLAGSTRTRTNRSGGIQGGISNGESIVIRVAFKPTSTISKEQM